MSKKHDTGKQQANPKQQTLTASKLADYNRQYQTETEQITTRSEDSTYTSTLNKKISS
jgi:hypothetical protein